MKLRHLFFALSLLLSVVVVITTADVVRAAWREAQAAKHGQETLDQLKAMMQAKEMASRERGPSNAVLGDETLGGDSAKRERLEASRLKTDQAFDSLLRSIAAEREPRPQLISSISQAQAQLTHARRLVDATAQSNVNARSELDIRRAVDEMIKVIEILDEPTLLLTNLAQASFHDLTDVVVAANLAAALREYAGQLGSHFTAPIAKRRTLSDQDRTVIERTRGRIEQLGQQLMVRIGNGETWSLEKQSHKTMRDRYFGSALAFVDAQFSIGTRDGQYDVDTAGFAARYVPDMDAIISLRDALMQRAQLAAVEETRRAQHLLWLFSGLGLSILGILGTTLWLVQVRLARPLERSTSLITAIAKGQLDLQVPQSRHKDELADILDAVAVLRDNSLARLQAEQERAELLESLTQKNSYLQINNRMLQRLSDGSPRQEVLDSLMLGIEEAHPCSICTVLLASPDGSNLHHAAAPSMPDFWKELTASVAVAEGVGSCGTAAFRKERVIVADIATDPLWAAFQVQAQQAGLRSCWSQPFLNNLGQVVGTFAIYRTKPGWPGAAEIDLIENYAKLVGVAVERSRLANALESSQALYQMIADNSSDVITVVELPDRQFSYVSPSIERATGFTPQDLLGKSISVMEWPGAEHTPQTLLDTLLSGLRESQATVQTLTYEHALQCKNGETIHVEVLSKVICGSDGTPERVINAARNISQRKIAEQALDDERRFFHTLLDNSPAKIGFVTDGHIRFANRRFIERFDVRYGDKSDSVYVHQEDFELIKQLIRRDGQLLDHEVQMYNRDRQVRDILATFINTTYQGHPGVMAWLEDITDKKALERKFAEQRKVMQNLLDYSPMGTAISVQGVFQYTNPAFIKLFDRRCGDAATAIYLHAEDRDKVLQTMARDGVLLNQDMKLCGANGQVLDCLVSFFPTEYNGTDGVMGWILDISDRKQAEEALRQASRYARSLLEASVDPLVTISSEGKITDVNRATESATGLSRDVLIGTDFSDYFTNPDAARAGYQKVFEDGAVKDYPLALKNQVGVTMDVLYNASLYFNEAGEVVGIFAAARDITERKRAEDAIRAMAFFDKLTGLPNRRMLEDRLQQLIARAERDKSKLSVLFIDLDKFKQVNDTHGHEAGDWLLQEVARRLTSCLRTSDTAARIGGDEFVVVLPDAVRVEEAVLVAEKIRCEMAKPFAMSETQILDISSSIGVVMFPDQADNPRDLLRFGDEAMYKAKKRGRNAVEVFSTEQQMLRLMWKPIYECGNETITQEHKKLFELANTLIDLSSQKDLPPQGVEHALENFLSHIRKHFEHEEAILREHNYPDQKHHADEHQSILDKAEALRHQRKDGVIPLGQLLDFLVFDVVGKHMEGDDTAFYYLFDPSIEAPLKT